MAYRLCSQDWSRQYLWDLISVEATDTSNGRCVFWMNRLLCEIRESCYWKKSLESVHLSVVSCVFTIVLRFDNCLMCGQVKPPQEANLWECERETELISWANTKWSVYDCVHFPSGSPQIPSHQRSELNNHIFTDYSFRTNVLDRISNIAAGDCNYL